MGKEPNMLMISDKVLPTGTLELKSQNCWGLGLCSPISLSRCPLAVLVFEEQRIPSSFPASKGNASYKEGKCKSLAVNIHTGGGWIHQPALGSDTFPGVVPHEQLKFPPLRALEVPEYALLIVPLQ